MEHEHGSPAGAEGATGAQGGPPGAAAHAVGAAEAPANGGEAPAAAAEPRPEATETEAMETEEAAGDAAGDAATAAGAAGAAGAAEGAAPLAEGWTEHVSPQGIPYFYNTATGESRWVRPEASAGGAEKRKREEEASGVEDVTHERLQEQRKKLEDAMIDVSSPQEEEQVEQAVAELSEARMALQAQLSSKDAILDPRVKLWMAQWLAGEKGEPRKKRGKTQQREVDHLIEMLSSRYEGYGEYVGLLMRWLDKADARGRPLGVTTAVDHFRELALKEFKPEKMLSMIEEGADMPPPWLVQMLNAPAWRKLLISLADKHKSVPVLDFCVRAICKTGHHAEVAQVMNTATYFAVFRRTFTDTLRGILEFRESAQATEGIAELTKLEERFRELAGYSQFTYMFAMEALEALEGSGEEAAESSSLAARLAGLSISAGNRSKIRRLRQGLENSPRKPNDAARAEAINLSNPINRRSPGGLSAGPESGGTPEVAALLRQFISNRDLKPETFSRLRQLYDPELNAAALSVPLWPLRRAEFLSLLTHNLFDPGRKAESQTRQDAAYVLAVASARAPGQATEREVFSAISEAVDICCDPATLTTTGLHKESEPMKRLAGLVKDYPPVSAGVISFARSLLVSPTFQKDACFTAGVRMLLSLIRCSMRAHPLQRVMAFFTIFHALPISPPNLSSGRLLEIKQYMLSELIALMECGFVFNVLDYIRNQALSGELDTVLLRYFLVQLAHKVQGPVSPSFAKAALQLLNNDVCSRAVRSAHNKESTRAFNDLKQLCTAAVSLVALQQPDAAHQQQAQAQAQPPSHQEQQQQQQQQQRGVLAAHARPLDSGSNKNKLPLAVSPAAAGTQRRETIRLVPFRPNK